MKRGHFRLVRVREQARHEIDHEGGDTGVARVLEVGDVLELIVNVSISER